MEVVGVERRCSECDALIASTSRRDRVYCSARCRHAAYERRRGPSDNAVTGSERREDVRPLRSAPDAKLAELERVLDRHIQEPYLVALIARAATTQWRAAAWILERRYPERWTVRRGDEAPEPDFGLTEDDPFAEVVQLARQRAKRKR